MGEVIGQSGPLSLVEDLQWQLINQKVATILTAEQNFHLTWQNLHNEKQALMARKNDLANTILSAHKELMFDIQSNGFVPKPPQPAEPAPPAVAEEAPKKEAV